jgi:hypothetical protein
MTKAVAYVHTVQTSVPARGENRSGEAPQVGEPPVARGASQAFALALAATLLMAAPVLVAPQERLFGSRDTLVPSDPNRDPLIVIEQFRTRSVPSPYLQPVTDLAGRTLARIVGPVAAYNAIVLATFPLAAAAAYLLARYVLGSHLAALVAGIAYAFLPFHVAHAAYHPHVAQTQWLPLYLLTLWRCLDRPDTRRAAFLLLAAAAVTLSNFYGGFIAAVSTPVALVAWAVVAPRRPACPRLKRLALTGGTLMAAAAGGLLFAWASGVLGHLGAYRFPRSDLFLHGARWWSYLLPAADHPLAGARVLALWAGRREPVALLEQQVGLGWSLLVLAAVPLWRALRGDQTSLAVRSAPVLAAVAVTALACSLSPERTIGGFRFVRPAALLYEIAPMFRAHARFGVVVGLMTALLAGAGAAWLWRMPGSAGRRAAALLLGLAVVEAAPFPPWRWRDVLPTRAHRTLAAQPGRLRVLDCVAASRVSDALAAPLLGHEVALLGAAFDDCGEPALPDKLRALGYTHAVMRDGAGFEGGWVTEVAAGPPPPLYVARLLGFSAREREGATTWRWMGQTGALRLGATEPSAGAALLVELKAFPRDRVVEWHLDGERRGRLETTSAWRSYTLPLGPLQPREVTLTLACLEPAVVADDVLHNGDPRSIALAVGQWRISIPPRP